jgi:hypothetical protein
MIGAGHPISVHDKGRYRHQSETTTSKRFQALLLTTEIPRRSFTASCSFCLLPIYRSVVCTEAWPSRNWICSSSPPELWHRRAQVRRRSCGARLFMPACSAHRFTAYQTTFAVTPEGCNIPPFKTCLNTLPSLTPECRSHASTSSLAHHGTGTFVFLLPCRSD